MGLGVRGQGWGNGDGVGVEVGCLFGLVEG